jgi:purine-binding chemotaxis protein CheW
MSDATSRALALRRAFDASFAAEPAKPPERIALIAVRAGARSYALPISELAGVVRFGGAAKFPSSEPAFLGIAVVRGVTVPVYDLAAIRDEGAARAPRWMLLAAGTEPLALAFDELEGTLRVFAGDIATAAGAGGAAAPALQFVRDGETVRPLISVALLAQRLKKRLGNESKER